MSNSTLVTYTKISAFKSAPRNAAITKITPHHVAGNLTVEATGQVFQTPGRNASSNYGIGSDGRVGMYVEEKDRSWCSSSAANDNAALTIEVANNTGTPGWTVSDKAWEALINLCVDMCRRNPGIKQKDGRPGIYCDDTPNASLTFHRYFSATGCAQPYIWNKRQELCAEVNKRLGATTPAPAPVQPAPAPTPVTPSGGAFKVGDIVQFAGGSVYTSSVAATAAQTRGKSRCKVTQVASSGKHPYHLISEDGAGVYGWVDASGVSAAGAAAPIAPFKEYLVRVTASNLNIRKGAGTSYAVTGSIKDKGVYTIVDEATGAGATKWGKLKSGAGWISLDHTSKL